MLSIKRRGAARLAAAVVASGLVAAGAIATAGPAAADGTTPSHGGATATLGGLKTFDQAVVHNDGGDQRVGAGLFEMAVDNGGTLQTYCIDIHNPTQQQAKYQEVPWSASSLHNNGDAGKIRWILQNSYPQVNDLAALAAKAGAGNLTEKTAAAGTQVAIWRFSDHAKVDAVDPAAEKLADYLEKSAQNVAEPKASLTLDPCGRLRQVRQQARPGHRAHQRRQRHDLPGCRCACRCQGRRQGRQAGHQRDRRHPAVLRRARGCRGRQQLADRAGRHQGPGRPCLHRHR